MPATRTRRPSRFVFDRLSWADYTRMLRICDRQGLRTTYIAGRLEVMSPSSEHEFVSRILGGWWRSASRSPAETWNPAEE